MIFGIVFSATIIFGVIIALLIASYSDYHDATEDTPKIKFSTFLTFYDINPSRWQLDYRTITCKIPRHLYGGLFDYTERFAFNYIDTLRYKHWHKNLQTRNTQHSNCKATAHMLEAVKQDMADLESQAKREHNKALEILRSITNVKS
jgi:hypothetical protein